MKNLKNFIVLTLLVSIFLMPINFRLFNIKESIKNNDNEYDILNSASSWVLAPFTINPYGSGDYTWLEANATDWCSGAGTELDPWVIENVTIDAGGLSNCLDIGQSNDYFIVKNCTFINSNPNYGLYLWSTNNGIVEDCTFSNNTIALYLSSCQNNTIQNNYFYNNTGGYTRIYGHSDNMNNTVRYNRYIHRLTSTLATCFAIQGINNKIIKNIVDNFFFGVNLDFANQTLIKDNTFIDGWRGISNGGHSFNATVFNNTISGTSVFGISANGNGSIYYNNKLFDNANNGQDYGRFNRWDYGVIGNYWDDYGGSDQDDDGIGDSPYGITGDAGSEDRYPIWDDGFNGTAIHIDGTGISAPDWNWAKTRTWCTGEGSLSNPYLIKDITIDCGSIGSGIYIEHSTNEYFTIQNCTIMHAQASGGFAAIHLDFVQNGTLFKNNCSNNYAGMLVEHSEGINILENLLYHNIGQGIIIYQSNYNQISYNAQKGSRYYGLFIQGQSHNNTISNNNFTENTHGTYNGDGIYIAHNSDGNIVFENLLKDNDRGIHVEDGSDNNEIYYNTIHDNAEYGILIQRNSGMTINNIFYGNNIVNPLGVNAYDNGTSTEWDYLNQGNYWGDYSGVDNDDDGIGDNPYYFSGTGTAHDNFPIWDDGLNPTPVISLILPSETSFGATAPTINLTISDNDLVTGWYTINSSATKYFFKLAYGENNIVINQSIWTALSEGSLTLAFFANDTKGSIGELFISLTKELPNTPTPPSIPAGNYFMIFMGFSIISLLIIVSRRRKLIHS